MKRLALVLAFLYGLTAYGQSYTTNFPATENPISQGGKWTNGGTTGIDWTNVQTIGNGTSGTAYGTAISAPPPYNDSIAMINGTWGANQMVTGTVVGCSGANIGVFKEISIFLRFTITAHSAKGLGADWSCENANNGQPYHEFGSWCGPVNAFAGTSGCPSPPAPTFHVGNSPGNGVVNGDVISVSIIGTTVTMIKNGVIQAQSGVNIGGQTAPFDTFDTAAGSPGIGFFLQSGTATATSAMLTDHGLTNVTATSLIAATCNQTDVNTLINGPTHTAQNGDVVIIPAGSCTWTTGVLVPAGVGISIIGNGTPNTLPSQFGAGTVNTNITDQTSSSHLLDMSPTFGNALARISSINFIRSASRVGNNSPINFMGTCTASGCPNFRLDNIIAPQEWADSGTGQPSDATFAIVANVVGVADHNTIGGGSCAVNCGNGIDLLNVSNGQWQGVGFFGDNSWASPDTFGTSQVIYIENTHFINGFGTDADRAGTIFGGGRYSCRFNLFDTVTGAGACTNHGTDTINRIRGGRQYEMYGNTGTCPVNGCSSVFGTRSGVGIVWGNNFTGGMNSYVAMALQRRWRSNAVWLYCGGQNLFDTNDGVTYYTGTVQSISGSTITISSPPSLTVNQWLGYSVVDSTHSGETYEIQRNTTAGALTIFNPTNGGGGGTLPNVGDSITILRATVCLDQVSRSGGQLVKDNAPIGISSISYNSGTVTVNTSATLDAGYVNGQPVDILSNNNGFNGYFPIFNKAASSFQYSSTQCTNVGNNCNSSSGGTVVSTVLSATSAPGAVSQSLDPTYEFSDISSSGQPHNPGEMSPESVITVPNRDYYGQVANQTAQTSPTLPFSGAVISQPISSWTCAGGSPGSCTINVPSTTGFAANQAIVIVNSTPGTNQSVNSVVKITGVSPTAITAVNFQGFSDSAGAGGTVNTVGVGWGTLANRPTTCSPTVGYWATDQPTGANIWNLSGGNIPGQSYAQGELFKCTATNTWTLSYTPYCWPHPLVSGAACTAPTGSVSVVPSSENFGSVVVGASSSNQTATLTNTTTASITITSVTTTGNTADFPNVTPPPICSGTIAANGGTCVVTTKFSPTSTGARSANIAIVTSAGTFNVALSGTGTSATLPGISINPASAVFGNITIGTPSAGTTFTMTSTTSANLVMGTPPATITGTNPGDFALVAVGGQCTNGQSIPQNSTCTEQVVFTPTAAGARSAQLSISDNVAGQPQVLTLSGTGVGTIALNPTSMNFGSVAQGQTSPGQLLTMTNNTGVTITLTGATFTNTTPLPSGGVGGFGNQPYGAFPFGDGAAGPPANSTNADWQATSNTCNTGTLTNGQSCTMTITFRPSSSTGTNETGIVSINYTGVGGSPASVPLAGTVLPPIGTPAVNIFALNLADCGAVPQVTTFCFTADGHIYVGICNPTCMAFKPLTMNVTGTAQ